MIDFATINRAAFAALPAILNRLVPGGKILGREYVARNPTRIDRRPGSFKVNMRTGHWADFATGDKGGDPISLVAYVEGVSQVEAARLLARTLGLETGGRRDISDKFAPLTDDERAAARPKAAADDEWTIVIPVSAPANSLRPDVVWKVAGKWKKPNAVWPYRDGEGRLLGYACRWNIPPKCDGGTPDKEFSFAAWCRNRNGECRWRLKHLPAPRPLYGLDTLGANPGAPVIICEGEKSADAATKVFPKSVCVTSPGGSDAADKADWSKVVIWPDADEPGAKYAKQVAEILIEKSCDVAIIDAEAVASLAPDGGNREPEKGWDAADAIGQWEDLESLRKAAASHTNSFAAQQGVANAEFGREIQRLAKPPKVRR